MKKLLHFLALGALLCIPWVTQGQETATLNDGTSTTTYVPLYGNYADYGCKGQFIIPATDLAAKGITSGCVISKLKFYSNSTSSTTKDFFGTSRIVEVGEVSYTSFSSATFETSGLTTVLDGSPNTLTFNTDGTMEVVFSTTYTYNGGNLLISIGGYGSGYKSCSWYGVTKTDIGVYANQGYSTQGSIPTSASSIVSVAPKVTITYEEPAGGCEKPTTLEADPVTHNSATLIWGGGSGTYNVEVKGGSYADWTEILHETTLTTTNLNDLTSITDYQVRVQCVCTGENSTWKSTSFTTECGPIVIGYQCGFEGPNTVGTGSYKLPTCWSRPDGTSTNYPGAYSSYGHNSSSYSLYFYGSATSTLQIAVLPEIDGGVNGKRLALYARNPSSYYSASFVVGYMTDPAAANTFVQVGDAISLSYSTPYGSEPYEFDFDNITGNPQYIAIKSTSTSSSSYFSIDDVELKAIPTCLRPTMNTTATDIATTTAKVSWTPNGTNQDHWDVYYCTSPYTAPTATTTPSVENTADNPCTLTGLTPTTSYRVYVRGNCGSGDVSEWSTNYCTFTTPAYCADMQVQYSSITATATAYNAATVTWTAAGGATQWKVQCSTDNTFATVDKEAVVDEATASFTGLTADQTYYVRIAPYCDEASDYTPWSANKTFTTPESCPAPVLAEATNTTAHGATLSWTGTSASYDVKAAEVTVNTLVNADFEDQTIPATWTNSTTDPWTITDADKHAGTYSIKSGGAGTAYAESDLTLVLELTDAATISFWYKASSESGYDYGRFLINGTQKFQTSGTSNSWAQYTFDLTVGTNTLVWKYYKDSGTDRGDDCFYVDDITISSSTVGTWQTVATGITESPYVMSNATTFNAETPYQVKVVGICPWTTEETASNIISFTTASSCETPTGLAESEVTTNSAKISWDGHGLTTFNLRYSSDGGANWTPVENVNSPYTFPDNLTDNTPYQVQVQATCNTAEWSTMLNFRTECAPMTITEVNYINEGFEDYTATSYNAAGMVPYCWDSYSTGTSLPYPHVVSGSSYNYTHGGNYSLNFIGESNKVAYVALPEFTNDLNTLMVNFWMMTEGTGDYKLSLGYITSEDDNYSTYQVIEEYDNTTTVTERTTYLTNVPATATRLVFRWNHPTTSWHACCIDDVVVKLAPSCRKPSGLTKDATTAHTATLHWTNGAEGQNAWQIAYSTTADFDPSTVTPVDVTTNPATISGLSNNNNAGQIYYAYVRANCGNGDYSAWSTAKATFNTLAGNQAPTGLTVNSITSTSAVLTWTGVATNDLHASYELYYSEENTAPTAEPLTTISVTAGETYTLTGLTAETEYYVWVRDNCGADGKSTWTALTGGSFTTLAACSVDDVDVINVGAHVADVTWNGESNSGFTVTLGHDVVSNSYIDENFTDGIPASGWDNDATYPWIAVGGYIKSGNAGVASSQSQISTTVTMTADGYVEFDAECRGEGTGSYYWDHCIFAIDGTQMFKYAAHRTDDGFMHYIFPVTAGEHTFLWKYTKDSSQDPAGDYFAIDNVRVYTTTTVWDTEHPIAIAAGTNTKNLTSLTPGTKYFVKVKPNCDENLETTPVDFTTLALPTKDITANSWYAIASPMHNSSDDETVAGVTNLATGTYDLMRYNEAAGTWESQKTGTGHTGFSALERGRGYIYRNAAATTLTFDGEPNSGAINASTTYGCADNNIKGFNLVGNPYNKAYAPTVAFYSLNTNGTWTAQTASPSHKVAVAEAFLIHVTAAGTYAFAEPSGVKGAPVALSPLAFTVSNDEYSDIAYAQFDGSEGLPKIAHLNAEAPVLSIPVNGRDYAIATLDNSVESFPLSFRGEGQYTLTVENSADFGYLHLIDHATGRDIDLLRQSTYTFNANGSADRFTVKLSPSTEENGRAIFVWQENGNVVVEGDGDLQVFDVMGRQTGTTHVDGTTTFSRGDLGMSHSGVYVLRLNGNSQKIVVK